MTIFASVTSFDLIRLTKPPELGFLGPWELQWAQLNPEVQYQNPSPALRRTGPRIPHTVILAQWDVNVISVVADSYFLYLQ